MTSYGYPITVSVATGRGRGKHSRRKLHAFAPAFPEVSGPGKWRPETPITPKQLDDAHRQGFGTRSKPLDMRALHAQRESSLGIDFDKPLSNESVHLADGVDVSGDVLAVIFDALESAERFEADLGAVNLPAAAPASRQGSRPAYPGNPCRDSRLRVGNARANTGVGNGRESNGRRTRPG